MGTREERKNEERLKKLLKETANKRCINCESLGPQYVVSGFNVFVCTVCSGVHRQFGHRVKGVSMSTFKTEEVQALAQSGNERFAAFFLAKWVPGALPKPVDRDVQRIHAWIAAVYQDRRFFQEPAGGYSPRGAAASAGTPSASVTSEGKEVVVRPLHEVLGSDTPKLKVQGSSASLERTVSAVSSTSHAAGAASTTPTGSAVAGAAGANGTASSAGAQRALNLLDSPKSAPAGAAPAAAAAWDPFGESSAAPQASGGAAAAPAGQGSPAAAPPAEAAWAAFGDTPAPSAADQPPAGVAAAPAVAAASGWEAFGDAHEPAPAAPATSGSSAPAASGSAAPAASAASAASSASSSPAKPQQPRQPVRSSSRPEVPMDIFYPEFEQIRATGMLPTGKPVPLHPFPPSYGAAAGAAPGGANPYAAYSFPAAAAQQQQQQQAAAYGGSYSAQGGPAGVRPTLVIPPAPLQPGYGYGPATAPARPGAPSPTYYSPSSGYSPAPTMSPSGSGFSPAMAQPNGSAPYGGSYDGGAALRSSTASLSDMLPGAPAPTPMPRRSDSGAAHDPFAGLAPGLRSALPAVPDSGSFKYAAGGPPGAPPPTPAGMPAFPQANGSGAAGLPPFSAPFAGAPSPAAGLAPATAAATATLFGRTPSLTGYDLSAPAAPKPAASGNPFA